MVRVGEGYCNALETLVVVIALYFALDIHCLATSIQAPSPGRLNSEGCTLLHTGGNVGVPIIGTSAAEHKRGTSR